MSIKIYYILTKEDFFQKWYSCLYVRVSCWWFLLLLLLSLLKKCVKENDTFYLSLPWRCVSSFEYDWYIHLPNKMNERMYAFIHSFILSVNATRSNFLEDKKINSFYSFQSVEKKKWLSSKWLQPDNNLYSFDEWIHTNTMYVKLSRRQFQTI